MTDANKPFVPVQLPADLVDDAREAARTMRRSVDSQIEFWATLGRALEHAGLSTSDSRALIARQERAPYRQLGPEQLPPELDELHTHVLAVAKSGALAARTREAVAGQKAKGARGKPRKTA